MSTTKHANRQTTSAPRSRISTGSSQRRVPQPYALAREARQRRNALDRSNVAIAGSAAFAGNKYDTVNVEGSANAHLGDNYYLNMTPSEDKRRVRKCLKAFRTTKYEQHKDVNPNRAADTCQWAIEHEQFQQWHRSDGQDLLWLSADPGCGKSVLSKYLVDDWLRANGYSNVCYFFFKDTSEQSRLESTLSSLLHQLFDQQRQLIKEHAMPYFEKLGKSVAQSIQSMWQILLAATSDPAANGQTVCVLDALDECNENHRRQLIEYLCQFYASSTSTTGRPPNLKFLVTSRDYDSVSRWFEKTTRRFPEIRLRGEDENENIHNEINLVIDAHVVELAEKYQLGGRTRTRLRTTLYKMEHRTYLWLYLTIDHLHKALNASQSPDDVRFDLLPQSVEQAYEQMLSRVDPDQRKQVQRIFRLILAARRPLKIQEITLALAILDGKSKDDEFFQNLKRNTWHLENHIRQWCGLFVFISDSRLYFIHQTAKEFLLWNPSNENIDSNSWKGCLKLTECEAELARLTIDYLSMQRFVLEPGPECLVPVRAAEDIFEDNDLFRYSAGWWASHLEAGSSAIDPHLVNKGARLCMGQSMLEGWFRYKHAKRYETLKRSTVKPEQFVAICVGSLQIVKRLKALGKLDPEAKDFRDETPLFWAVKSGNEALLRWVSNEVVKWSATSSVLSIAAEQAYIGATWLLLNKKGPLAFRARRDDGETALHLAAQLGRVDLVKVLLDTGANVDSKTRAPHGTSMTALMIAAKEGFEDIVKLLIERSASINKVDAHGHTALDLALINKHDAISAHLRSIGGKSNYDDGDDTMSDGWEVIEHGEDLLDSTGEFIKISDTLLQENG